MKLTAKLILKLNANCSGDGVKINQISLHIYNTFISADYRVCVKLIAELN